MSQDNEAFKWMLDQAQKYSKALENGAEPFTGFSKEECPAGYDPVEWERERVISDIQRYQRYQTQVVALAEGQLDISNGIDSNEEDTSEWVLGEDAGEPPLEEESVAPKRNKP